MKNGEIQVVGVKSYEKNDNLNTILDYMTPYSDYDVNNCVCSGLSTGQIFTRSDLSAVHVGDIIQPIYSVGFQGKAVFNGYNMVKPAVQK